MLASGWALNLMTGILVREGEREIRDTDTRGRREAICRWRQRLDFLPHEPRNAWGYQNRGAARKDSPLEPSEGM